MTEEKFLTHEEASNLLKISERTLDTLLIGKNPPPVLKIGSQRRYLESELISWAKALKNLAE